MQLVKNEVIMGGIAHTYLPFPLLVAFYLYNTALCTSWQPESDPWLLWKVAAHLWLGDHHHYWRRRRIPLAQGMFLQLRSSWYNYRGICYFCCCDCLYCSSIIGGGWYGWGGVAVQGGGSCLCVAGGGSGSDSESTPTTELRNPRNRTIRFIQYSLPFLFEPPYNIIFL